MLGDDVWENSGEQQRREGEEGRVIGERRAGGGDERGEETRDWINGQSGEVSGERCFPIFTPLLLGAPILSIYPS